MKRRKLSLGILATAIGLSLVATACAQPERTYRMPSRNMEPTILAGELFSAQPLEEPSLLRHGDVVVFRNESGMHVGRVIAVSGERVSFSNGVPIVDGVAAILEPVVGSSALFHERSGGQDHLIALTNPANVLRDVPELSVSEGFVFLVGDGRDVSNDSRRLGPVPVSAVTHRVKEIVDSADFSRVGLAVR